MLKNEISNYVSTSVSGNKMMKYITKYTFKGKMSK